MEQNNVKKPASSYILGDIQHLAIDLDDLKLPLRAATKLITAWGNAVCVGRADDEEALYGASAYLFDQYRELERISDELALALRKAQEQLDTMTG